MELLTVVKERRSVRKYSSRPVSEEMLLEILEAARLSPSWANFQVCRFIVVRDQEVKQQLQETMGPNNPVRNAFVEAPIVICVAAQRGLSGFRKSEPSTNKGDWFMFDAGIVMEHLVLAAWNLGLGTCHVGSFDASKAEAVLKVPEGYSIVAMTPLGYFDTPPEARPRKPLKEIVFSNRFGAPYIK